ncbi:SDR family oxidoreductase [Microcoleus asticus]|uniref:3-oxoacyl-[acyl-carrier-protein] reductase FabG n=1 Tax=Microcoleus asticus IPMA8 TaxID=2563858 RepID=A0ABX2D0X9_9CYAN|nr:SDR family oxidoreductase [Microcoleus asticus]NQE35808.1 3-oxoacyl-[acyl-carrier-protein] reductase FabG [Microcoleus asticus IPMA8]
MVFTSELKGKVALVTGGSSGIGKATAFAFARAGAKVVVASRRIAEGEETVHQICERGGDAIFITTDVSKATEVEALIDKTVGLFGRLDYACNNAGVVKFGSLTEHSEADWSNIIDVNLKGLWLCLKYEILAMLKHGGGAIVNIASGAGLVGGVGHAIYSASKGGAISLTRAAALEYAKSGVRINAISPGPVKTNMLDSLPTELVAQLEVEQPIGRIGKPEEIGDAVVWLCSDKASFVTGHNLVIDGGYTIQ